MPQQRESVLLISDFNVDILAGLLENDEQLPRLESRPAPFGQVFQALLNPTLQVWTQRPDYTLVWTKPESVLASFDAAMQLEPISTQSLLSEVDEFCAALKKAAENTSFLFVPTWAMDPRFRGHGMLEMAPAVGIKQQLLRANLRLSENLSELSNAVVFDSEPWFLSAGLNAYSSKLWYLSKVPFDTAVFKSALFDLKAAIRGIRGDARKLVIVDLDDTLWGGVVGDLGWENLRLGGHDPVGEAFVDFQRRLKGLSNRGVLLGIVSKNTESVALDAIQSHPEMVLALRDFAGWRINWNDKAANIASLVSELKLGLQSVVFIDDNPVERGRVADALPDVLVPEWPSNKMLYPGALSEMNCFDIPSISTEDRNRSHMYSAERERRQSKTDFVSVDEWLKTLNVEVQIEMLHSGDLARATQLLNKTNQMNLSTRRLTESEFHAWASEHRQHVWTVRARDRYGDSGLTGLISLKEFDDEVGIVDFILSCRVMGRKIEETMLHFVYEKCSEIGAASFFADFIETPKNMPCHDFFLQSGMLHDTKTGRFSWNMENRFTLPDTVQLIDNDSSLDTKQIDITTKVLEDGSYRD